MSLALFVYFASIVQSIILFTIFVGIILLLVAFVLYIHAERSRDNNYYKYGNRSVMVSVFLFLVTTFTPSEKAMYTIAGAYLVQSAYQSETGDKIVRLINSKIDEQLSKIEKMQPAVPAK